MLGPAGGATVRVRGRACSRLSRTRSPAQRRSPCGGGYEASVGLFDAGFHPGPVLHQSARQVRAPLLPAETAPAVPIRPMPMMPTAAAGPASMTSRNSSPAAPRATSSPTTNTTASSLISTPPSSRAAPEGNGRPRSMPRVAAPEAGCKVPTGLSGGRPSVDYVAPTRRLDLAGHMATDRRRPRSAASVEPTRRRMAASHQTPDHPLPPDTWPFP